MRLLRAVWMRVHRMRDADGDFDAELASHIEMHVDDAMRRGLTRDEARREALLKLGGAEQTRQAVRDRATLPAAESVLQDVRFAVRQMLRAPGFTLTAIITLALGIGANTIIYTLVDSILLRPLPYTQQDRLMRVGYGPDEAAFFPKGWIRALGEHSSSFTAISGYGADSEQTISDGGAPQRVFGSEVTADALGTLGLQPAAGRFFSPDDAIAGHDPVVVLSYGFWRQRYGASPQAIGQSLRIDGVWRRIIGVTPAGVRFPYGDTQFVTPVTFVRSDARDPWTGFTLRSFGRLREDVTPAQAQAELRKLHGALLPLFPWRMPDIWAAHMTVVPLLESETGAMRPKLLLLFGAVGLILLIACANVANLMLARATARERELAIRGALGASGRRLIQQLLSESLVLGLAAGVVGLAAAFASLRVFVGLLPADTPRLQDVGLHASDVVFTLGASLLAGLIFGIIPAVKMASINLLSALRTSGRGVMGRGAGFVVSTALVMAQIGLSVVVVTAAGLTLHSLYRLSQVDPGFRISNTVTAEVALDAEACKTGGRCAAFFSSLRDMLPNASGIERAALVDSLPLSGLEGNYVFDAEGHPRDPRQGALMATGRTVTSDYFDALQLKLTRGRLLGREDESGATRAIVLNESMAERLWPHEDPLGKHVLNVADEPAPAVWSDAKASEVVGVVRNTREGGLDEVSGDQVYRPMTPARNLPVMYVVLRSHLAPAGTADALRQVVEGINAQAAVTHVRTMDEVVARSVAAPRALAMLLLGFGALAVVIGAVGVYSLIAYMVSWRTQEIGLRLALGAQRWQIVLGVVRQSLLLAAGGCIVGLGGAIALSRVLRSFLFEVNALDPLTYAAVPMLMLLVALLAAWIPARRAAAVDPMIALRGE